MPPKGDAHRSYLVHGDGLDSISTGLIAIRMPEHRRHVALALTREVARVNHARHFRWYKTPGKDELCCWWDEHEANVLWVWQGNVHVKPGAVTAPTRPTDWIGHDGHVGWLLPGAQRGSGGGPRRAEPGQVVCPVTFIAHPVGTECPDCEVVHPTE
jgi:hypothetical protein